MALTVFHFDHVYLEYEGERPTAVPEVTDEGEEMFVAQQNDVICVDADTAHRLLEKDGWRASNVVQLMIDKLARGASAMGANVEEALGVAQSALGDFAEEVNRGRLSRRRLRAATDRMGREMARASGMLGRANAEVETAVEEINNWHPPLGGRRAAT